MAGTSWLDREDTRTWIYIMCAQISYDPPLLDIGTHGIYVIPTSGLDERLQPPYSLPHSRPDYTKANPKAGAVQLTFNITGSLLLARFESSPTAIFLFSFPSPAEHDSKNHQTPSSSQEATVPKLRSVLIHSQAVTSTRWNPVRRGILAVCTGNGSLYLWSDEWVGEEAETDECEEVAECIGVPASTAPIIRHLSCSTDTFDKQNSSRPGILNGLQTVRALCY